jgi:hypothetical protein
VRLDLRLEIFFKRDDWIKHVLKSSEHPDFDGHLAERLNENA